MRSIQNCWGPGSDPPMSCLSCVQDGNTWDCCPWWYCLLPSRCRSRVYKILDTPRDPRIPCTYKMFLHHLWPCCGCKYIRERASTGSSAAIYRYHWSILEGSRDRLTDGSTMGSSDTLDGNWYTMRVLDNRESKVQNVAAWEYNIKFNTYSQYKELSTTIWKVNMHRLLADGNWLF